MEVATSVGATAIAASPYRLNLTSVKAANKAEAIFNLGTAG
jgi:hypothetical protein